MMKLNHIKGKTTKKKDNIILTIAIILSIIMVYSLVQALLYEKGTDESNFWFFMLITGTIGLGGYSIIIVMGMLTHQFKKADVLNYSEIEDKNFKTLIKIKFKYIIVSLCCIGFFGAMGTVITYLAITLFIEQGIFPNVLFYFLFITGLIMIFFFGFILMIYEAKTQPKET